MDEYFQNIELNKIKLCETDDYREDISKKLDVIKRRLKFLRISKENITDIVREYSSLISF